MDLQLKRVLELRRNDCKKVINFINSVNFSSLDDKQIRTLVMIRELGAGIVNRHRKLATEDDVSRTLKLSIEYMAGICRAIVEEINMASFEDASEKEKEVFLKILEIARGIAEMQGPSTVNRCRDLNVPFEDEEEEEEGEEEEEEDEEGDDDDDHEEMGELDGDVVMQIEARDEEEFIDGQPRDMLERGIGMEIELADKEGLTAVYQSHMQVRELGLELEMTDKEGPTALEQTEVSGREVWEITSADKEGLTAVDQSDMQEREVSMEIQLAHNEGLNAVEQSKVQERDVGTEILLADTEVLPTVEQSDAKEREINVEMSLADKEGLTAVEQIDMQEVQIGTEIESGDKEQLDSVAQRDLQEDWTDVDMRSYDQPTVFEQQGRKEDRQISTMVGEHAREPISWPLNGEFTRGWIIDLMETLKWFSRKKSPSELSSVMPLPVVELLMSKASHILHEEPNCVMIQCDEDTEVVVVGDLHGQYLDLLTIWEHAGLPSEKHLFVFSGNYVDRELSSLELFLVLLAWKVFLPRSVYLLRGNHESRDNKKIEGFLKDLNPKFPEYGRTVYRRCLETFAELPLASVIADSVYITHGGLFRSKVKVESTEEKETTKTYMKRTGRKKQKTTPTLCLGSLHELALVNRFIEGLPARDSILGDVLCSDPTMELGLMENDRRGIGLLWGPDCTETFLKQSKLKVIIRSHEGPDERAARKGLKNLSAGYSEDHTVESGKLYTLFSAPDILQYKSKEDQIKGAYAVLNSPHFATPEFESFETTERREVNGSMDINATDSGKHQASIPLVNVSVDKYTSVEKYATNSGEEEGSIPLVSVSLDKDVSVEKNTPDLGEEQGLVPLSSQASTGSASLAPQFSAIATSSAAQFEPVTPAPWLTTLADDADGSQPVQISGDPEVEGFLQDKNKANYEFLLNLIGSLKKEIKQKNDELEDYKRKYDSPAK